MSHENLSVYLDHLKKNYAYWGLPFKAPSTVIETRNVHVGLHVRTNGTVRVELTPRFRDAPMVEKHIEYLDQVQVRLSVLKNGKVRVKCVLHGAQLYEKYWSKAKRPPIKAIVTAYTHLGYSQAFIDAFKAKHAERLVYGKKVGGILEAIFDKSIHAKRKKEEEPKEEDPEEDEEDEEEDPGPEEDEAIVADDEDPEDEEPEELEDLDDE